MRDYKRLMALLLVFVMAVTMSACAAPGGETHPTGSTQASVQEGSNRSYSVSVRTAGGMVMPGVQVYVYADDTLEDLKHYGETDEQGCASFELPESGNYAAVLSGVPEGYDVAASYAMGVGSTNIVLNSSLIQGENLSSATLGLGDVMYDFTVVTPDGESITLSEMLQEKDVVLINFWYDGCTWCDKEFPYMQQAYEQYGENVGIIALSPYDDDNAIRAYQEQRGLTFPMASCPPAWPGTTFGVTGYPTSILVDRYGVICLVEAGGIVSLRPFVCMFDHFTSDDYQQTVFTELSQVVTEVKPTYTMDTPENVAAVLNNGDIPVTYHAETEEGSAEYSWPFIQTEKNGEVCMKASNQGIESSFAILYADVYLEAGQAVGFDYLASSEKSCDILYVIVDGEDIYGISGTAQEETWETCYPWVAEEAGTYEVALCYLKDEDTNEGDDTVYIKNMRIVDQSEIDTVTFIPRFAASTEDGFDYTYVDVALNEEDGYYHVGTVDGPLLLADLMNYTLFSEDKTVWEMVLDGQIVVDGKDIYEDIVDYCSYASNSSLYGVCTVNAELAELLKQVAEVAGFDGGENEWLKICKFFQVYGAGEEQLDDPIAGLAPFSAYEAKLGVGVETNYFYYDRGIIPRGLLARFVPTASGVYRITSHTDYQDGLDAWIFNENRDQVYVYEQDERMFTDNTNVSMVVYMEAGEEYYIDIAFWDMYEVGYIYYDIEYVAPSYELFRLAAPGYFTYDTNATGDAMYHLINGGIDVVLNPEDGIYYEDLGLDENGNQRYGSKLYADFVGLTTLFNRPIATVPSYDEDGNRVYDENGDPVMIPGMIEKSGFDFSKTENDLYILSFLEKHDFDVEATDAYLRELWGETYESYAEIYLLEDVYEGKYHGEGEDMTEAISAYLDKIITSGSQEVQGCVVVDQQLAQILQMLMDKYTFENVDDSWIKLCYYYDYLGPEG